MTRLSDLVRFKPEKPLQAADRQGRLKAGRAAMRPPFGFYGRAPAQLAAPAASAFCSAFCLASRSSPVC
jgi:hypothetical protein